MSENMHEIKTSTAMLGNFLYHGTYETYIGELLYNVKPSERDACEDEIAKIYLDMLEEIVGDVLPSELDDSFRLSYDGMYHPRYYNFETDSIEFTISFNDDFKSYFGKYADDNRDDFDKFLHDNFTSRSGFVSWTPNNYHDWDNGFENNDNKCISVLIWYFLDNECDEESDVYWFYNRVAEMVRETYTPYEYAVRFNNGYIGYCVNNYDEDADCDRFDAYLFDTEGNVTTAHIIDENWEYNSSTYSAWDNELEYEVTNRHERVGYGYDEMDIREFHKLYDGKF